MRAGGYWSGDKRGSICDAGAAQDVGKGVDPQIAVARREQREDLQRQGAAERAMLDKVETAGN